MKDKEKTCFLILLNHLNKKFAKGKIKINRLYFTKKDKGRLGVYFIRKKEIGISNNFGFLIKFSILNHELAHAYQHQILEHNSSKGLFITNVILGKRNDVRRVYDKKRHNRTFFKIEKMFKEETDKFIREKINRKEVIRNIKVDLKRKKEI
jgi:hypothetical protein